MTCCKGVFPIAARFPIYRMERTTATKETIRAKVEMMIAHAATIFVENPLSILFPPCVLIVQKKDGLDFPFQFVLDGKRVNVSIDCFAVGDCLNGKRNCSERVALDSCFNGRRKIEPDRASRELFLVVTVCQCDGIFLRHLIPLCFKDFCYPFRALSRAQKRA